MQLNFADVADQSISYTASYQTASRLGRSTVELHGFHGSITENTHVLGRDGSFLSRQTANPVIELITQLETAVHQEVLQQWLIQSKTWSNSMSGSSRPGPY